MKLAFVIQRYGLEVNGGAELHCRWLAERLAQKHEVEVFTTCALDYLEWKNHFKPGTEIVNGIPVHRFPVRRKRVAREFASLCNVVFYETHTRDEEEDWVRSNGPDAPALVKAVGAARERFDYLPLLLLPLLPELLRPAPGGGPRDPGAHGRRGPRGPPGHLPALLPPAPGHRLPDPGRAGARGGRGRQPRGAEHRHRQRPEPPRARPSLRLSREVRLEAAVRALRRAASTRTRAA